ncbi:MAG: hypothetical protein OEW06_15155, partial [Gemmatimonadota bacterium]|nr:hypothetical protein [Gemmatimonadota bacterium]
GAPFPVTRGKTFYVQPGTAGRAAAAAVNAPVARTARGAPGRSPSLHGRVSLEANAFESTTRWQSNDLESVTRRFATPALGLRAVAAGLPGGVSLNTNLRALYRYSDPELISPTWAVQVYQASLTKAFSGSVPVYLEAGRFTNRYASFSGVWDGLLMHVGGRGLGAGFAAGFEPDRGDQGVSTTLPKVAGFVTYDAGDGPVRYATDVSVNHVRPTDDRPDHTYAGWSQYLRVSRLRLGSDLQVDRNPETDQWVITRLNATASIPMVTGLELRGRISMFQPYQFWRTTNLISFRRDQGSVGLFFWRPQGSLSVDFTAARLEGGETSYTYAGTFSLLRTPVFGLDFSASASYWTQGAFTALYGTGGIARGFGPVMTRASYQLYRAGDDAFRSLSHTGDLSLSIPLARSVYATLQGRIQRGDNLWTNGLFAGLWTAF